MNKKLGPNVEYTKDKSSLSVTITNRLEGWMSMAIFGWVMVWTGMGAYVFLYMLFSGLANEELIFFSVYLAFWAWFEYKALYGWLYKKYGYERILVENGSFVYSRNLFSLKKSKKYDLEEVKPSSKSQESERSFAASYNKSFWIVGNEQIQIPVGDKLVRVGMHITPKETTELIRVFNQSIKK